MQSSVLAADWIASRVTQPAKFTVDGDEWVTITRGTIMPSASWIHTGKRGRLIVNRGKETIQFKPNTMAAIAKRNKSGSKTLVRQQFGSLLLDVETRKQKHLTVETPFLAAVVKGTRFSVDVGSSAATLSVERGVVEVTDQRRGERVDVRTNQSVNVAANSKTTLKIVGAGPKAKIQLVKATTPKLKANKKAPKKKKTLSSFFERVKAKAEARITAAKASMKSKVENAKSKFYQKTKNINSTNTSTSTSTNTKANSNSGNNGNGNGNSSSSNGNSSSSNSGSNGNSSSSNSGGNGNSSSSNSSSNGNSSSSNSGGNGNSSSSNSGSNGNSSNSSSNGNSSSNNSSSNGNSSSSNSGSNGNSSSSNSGSNGNSSSNNSSSNGNGNGKNK